MLHLAVLTVISFVPGERAGVSIKKVCLRKEAKKQFIATGENTQSVKQLLTKAPVTEKGKKDGTVEIHCSVKLISTAPTSEFVFVPLYLGFHTSGYKQATYLSFSKLLEPDPPRLV